jgi:primosomal protein N'
MKLKQRYFSNLFNGKKVSRKFKKHILGKKISKSQLSRLLKTVTLGEPITTMFERRDIFPYAFCPKCGCSHYSGSGNMTSYPEHWEEFRCLRCSNLVGYIDNSRFIHALECKEFNYDPSF